MLDAALPVTLLVLGLVTGVPDRVRFGVAVLAGLGRNPRPANRVVFPPLKDIKVGLRALPRSFDGYTILQLTDLHITRFYPAAWACAVVARSNAISADLIVVTADLADGTIEARHTDVEPLRDLHARDGVYVVSGNHENIFRYRAWMAHYAAMGLRVIDDAHVVLTRDEGKLTFVGASDGSVRRRRRAPDLAATLAGAPKRDLLTHFA